MVAGKRKDTRGLKKEEKKKEEEKEIRRTAPMGTKVLINDTKPN